MRRKPQGSRVMCGSFSQAKVDRVSPKDQQAQVECLTLRRAILDELLRGLQQA